MSNLVVNIIYTGKDDNAKLFAKEMIESGLVAKIRNQEGNISYDYYQPMENSNSILLIDIWTDQKALDIHHKSPMMKEIAKLRDKYKLHMKVTRYIPE